MGEGKPGGAPPREACRGQDAAVDLLHTPEDLASWRRDAPAPLALVPTMGTLHAGHLAHAAAARAAGAATVLVSVFVNPTQFDDPADLAAYPRQPEADAAACANAGADAVFAPDAAALYPPGAPAATVDVPALTTGLGLEDAHRPGHFAGVARVVVKLLALCRPDLATFGRKDLQQLRLVQALAADLCLGVGIVEVPTLREPDGLAMSSRNARLDPAARRAAAGIHRALRAAEHAAAQPGGEPAAALRRALAEEPALGVEYAEVRDAATLRRSPAAGVPRVALVAARVGGVRLVDNQRLP